MAIPVIIGVTGHRYLREQDNTVLRGAVRSELKRIVALCPNSPVKLLTGLAEGADTLCAEEAAGLDIGIIAVLPVEKNVFINDFSGEARDRFLALCDAAENVVIAPDVEKAPDPITREHRFRQVGIYIVEHSHVLLALWDGEKPKNAGCGTAEVTDMLLRGSYAPEHGAALRNLDNEAFVHIVSPRNGAESMHAGEILREGDTIRELLQRTDDFNRLSYKYKKLGHSLFAGEPEVEGIRLLNGLYRSASGMSAVFSGKYRWALRILAAASSILAAAFLLYDEIDLTWMLFVCGGVMLLAWLCRGLAIHSDCHRRYIEYRELAEALRVQAYLRYAGSRLDVKNVFPWSQQHNSPWIFAAVCAVSVYPTGNTLRSIVPDWIDGQAAYHGKARLSTERTLKKNDRLVLAAAILSTLLYIFAIGFELFCGNLLSAAADPAEAELWRMVIKVALGSVSVGTVFLSGYYGKLSLQRKLADHERMERFYRTMSSQIRMRGQTEELLELMAREELVENSNWCAYQSDNAPTFDL